MSRSNIYIRKENEDYWDSLADKSQQVNSWIIAAKSELKSGDILDSKPKLQVLSMESSPKDTWIIPAAETVESRKLGNACKIHGIPLTANGKCLQKGCKYA